MQSASVQLTQYWSSAEQKLISPLSPGLFFCGTIRTNSDSLGFSLEQTNTLAIIFVTDWLRLATWELSSLAQFREADEISQCQICRPFFIRKNMSRGTIIHGIFTEPLKMYVFVEDWQTLSSFTTQHWKAYLKT